MSLPELRHHLLLARIISLTSDGSDIKTASGLSGMKTDDQLILEFGSIGNEVRCLQIKRYVQTTYEYAGKTQIVESAHIGSTHFYMIQRNTTAKISDKHREIPVHEKYLGKLRIIGSVLKMPQPTTV